MKMPLAPALLAALVLNATGPACAAATPYSVWDVIYEQMQGWTVGAEWAIIKNTVATLEYGQGRYIDQNGDKIRQLFANVECFL